MFNRNTQYNQSTANITTSASAVLAANPNREYLLIQNNGGGTVYLNFSGTATSSNGIKLDPEEAYEPNRVPTNALSVIGAASATLVIVEG